MENVILFLLKTMAISGLFTLLYFTVLRGRRLHQYNRAYLTGGILMSVIIPLLQFRTVQLSQPFISNIAPLVVADIGAVAATDLSVKRSSVFDFNWMAVAGIVMTLISLVLVAILLIKLFKVARMCRNSCYTERDGVRVVFTDKKNAPFTFIRYIFWNEATPIEGAVSSAIYRHELAHAKQLHTYDKLLAQTLTAVFWMNPFFWLMKRELEIVHEFLADEFALHDRDTRLFSLMLLKAYRGGALLMPEHHFFASGIKRRLAMLQNSPVRYKLLRQLLALPLITISILLFAFKVVPGGNAAAPVGAGKPMVVVIDAAHGGADAGATTGVFTEKEIALQYALRLKELAKQYNIDVKLTRNNDSKLSLEERVAMATKEHPDLFLSLHVGAETEINLAREIEIYVSGANKWATQSSEYGGSMLGNLQQNGFNTRQPQPHKSGCTCGNCPGKGPLTSADIPPSVKNGIYVLKNVQAPAVVVELGNINSANTMELLTSSDKIDALCNSLLQGMLLGAEHNQQNAGDPMHFLQPKKKNEGCAR